MEEKYQETIYLKAGSATALELPFSGNPQPKVKWTYLGKTMPQDKKRVKEETIYGMTCITLAKVVRSDSGDYKCVLENKCGKAELTVKIVVKGIS